jgi:hypothetical protein
MTLSKRLGIFLLGGIIGAFALELGEQRPIPGVHGLISSAEAKVGRPRTPVSVAGVARRTTRRSIVETSTYVDTLPPDCTTVIIEDTTLWECNGEYYLASGTEYVLVNVE